MLKLFNVISVLFSALVIAGCNKGDEGCTDSIALNYSSEATIDDGHCQYEREVYFWYDSLEMIDIQNSGAIFLEYYASGFWIYTDSSYQSNYSISDPGCGYNDNLTSEYVIFGSNSSTFDYEVRNQTGTVLYSGSVLTEDNGCFGVQLN